jgi:hypothetical protein
MDLAYLGTIPMLLAILGIFRKKMPPAAKWLVIAGLLIPLTPLVGPLYHRVQLLFLLGGSWMAAEMLAEISGTAFRKLVRPISAVVVALGIALTAGTLLPAGIKESIDHQIVMKALSASAGSSFGDDRSWIESRAKNWISRFSWASPETVWVFGLLAVGTCGLAISTGRNTAMVVVGNVAILFATSLELFTFFQNWTTYSDLGQLSPKNPAIEQVRNFTGRNRVFQRVPDLGFTEIFATPNLLASYFIPSVDSYESIQYRSSMVVLSRLAPDVQPKEDIPLDGTTHWPIVATVAGFSVRKNLDVPSPVTAGNGPTPETAAHILASLSLAKSISPSLETMNRLTFEAPAGSTWIRISQNWHEGWRWKTPEKNWQSFRNGPDAACWIDAPPPGGGQIKVQFFPSPGWILISSVGIFTIWLGLLIRYTCCNN